MSESWSTEITAIAKGLAGVQEKKQWVNGLLRSLEEINASQTEIEMVLTDIIITAIQTYGPVGEEVADVIIDSVGGEIIETIMANIQEYQSDGRRTTGTSGEDSWRG